MLVLTAALAVAGSAGGANPQVAGLQVALRAHGVYRGPINAVAGPATIHALRRFQRRAGLKPDGLAGLNTRRALGRLGRPLYGRRVLRPGLVGWDVAVLQFLLGHAGHSPGRVDASFGPRTKAALRRFQRARHIRATGIAGRRTLAALCHSSACLARSAPRFSRYVVREGDTLTALARRFHTSITELARLNRLDPHKFLIVGTRLRVPRSS